jgi:hypothetical protein
MRPDGTNALVEARISGLCALQEPTDGDLKYSILHLVAGTEVLLKARAR